MSFVTAAALLVGLLVATPLIAHLLRRGRAQPQAFPPARLVPARRSVARQRSRLEDRSLFALRALAILLLALLGATPLVRCSRLSLARSTGASIALALVIDDSLSMRAKLEGSARFERALRGANEILSSTRRGDAVTIVLAGRPARVALTPTTDLEAVKKALGALSVTDRATDLDGAVQMARALLHELPQRDRQLAVFSDFAADSVQSGEPTPWAALPELAKAADDCGLVGAERTASGISASVVCNAAEAARDRRLEALTNDPSSSRGDTGKVLGSAELIQRKGPQTVTIAIPAGQEALGVRLTGQDSIEHDDSAPVALESLQLQVAVSADSAHGTEGSGTASLVEHGLRALGGELAIRPLSVLPDDSAEFARYAALILDDPSGLSPEVRAALSGWVTRGGVAVALLGRRAESAVLGATLEPFTSGALPWEATHEKGLDLASTSWIGPEAAGFSELNPRGRARLESALGPESSVRARWDDGAPFWLERRLGSGMLLTLGLPSSADESDFALRPGFLAVLDHVLTLAREHSGQRRGLPGVPLRFPAASRAELSAPDGTPLSHENEGTGETAQHLFTPELAGRYRVRAGDGSGERIVSLDPTELAMLPQAANLGARALGRSNKEPSIDVSPEVARAAAGLVGIEVLLRLYRGFRRRSRQVKGDQRPLHS